MDVPFMWESYVLCGVCAITFALIVMQMRRAGPTAKDRRFAYVALCMVLSGGGYNGWLAVDNAMAGCFPWVPKVVDYYPGMTLCPGQEAVFKGHIIIPMPLPSVRVPAAGERGI